MLSGDPLDAMDVDEVASGEEEMACVNNETEIDEGLLVPGPPAMIYTGMSSSQEELLSTKPSILEISQDVNPSTAPSLAWHEVERGQEDKSSSGSNMSLEFDSDDDIQPDIDDASPIKKPFDLGLLRRSLEKGCATLDQVTGKDVVLVVGKTGTGKSTFIQAVAGKRLKSVEHMVLLGQKRDFHQVFEAEDPLEGFEIGHAKLSATKAINSYEWTTSKDSKLIFVDSPGFEDTDGHEVDIATSFMLSEVAKRCKSLRFVFLINFVSLLEDRGGAITTVLKFISEFVQDFELDKKSFMFLFSHTNEMKDVASIDDAKKKVYLEVLQMIKATKDVEVHAILKFMKQSFDRGYLFVNIFDPIMTNFAEILHFIESQLKPVKFQTISTNCCLTLASKYKLTGEVQRLGLEIQSELKNLEFDTDKVKELFDTICFLESRIPVKDISDVKSNCARAIDDFCAKTNDFINSQIERSADLEHEFQDRDKATLVVAIEKYESLCSGSPRFIEAVLHRLVQFKEDTILTSFDCGEVVALRLRKLRVWAGVSPPFQEQYEQAVQHFREGYGKAKSYLLGCDLSSIFLCEEKIREMTKYCALVDAIAPSADALVDHSLPVHDAIQASTDIQSALISEIISWGRRVESMESHSLSDKDLRQLLAHAEKLHVLQSCIKSPNQRLRDEVDCVMCLFETLILDHFEKVASEMELVAAVLGESDVTHLRVLSEVSHRVASFDGSNWKQAIPIMNKIIFYIRSKVLRLESDIQIESNTVSQSGFKDGEYCATLLGMLNQYIFLDDLLGNTDAFVKNVSIAMLGRFEARMSVVNDTVDKLLTNLTDAQSKTTETGNYLDKLTTLLPEIEEISKFTARTGNSVTLRARVHSGLRKYLDQTINASNNVLLKWKTLITVFEDPTAIGHTVKDIDSVLHILVKFQNCKEIPTEIGDAAEVIKSKIISHLEQFSVLVDEMFSVQKPDFCVLSKILSCIENFGSFFVAGSHLPYFQELRLRATKIVSVAAEAVENMIETTACWDEIDELLSRLKDAQVLDRYTGSQASSRLGPLQKLRQQKSEDVDETVEQMIQRKDFMGIGELIVPLANSKDQLKRRKFSQYCHLICDHLRDVERKVKLSIESLTCETAQSVLEGLKVMENASTELASKLKPEINLKFAMATLKQELNAALKLRIEKFDKVAEKSIDFIEMATSVHEVSWLVDLFQPFVFNKTKSEIKRMDRVFQQKKEEVSFQVDRFFSQNFSEGSRLFQILSGLQMASELHHEATTDLSHMYLEKRAEITERLVNTLRLLASEVDENFCYNDGVGILSSLDSELQNGMSKHIDVERLPYDCNEKLLLWKENIRKEESDILLNGMTDHQISSLSDKLNKMRSSRLHFFGWKNRKSYEDKCCRLQREADAMYKKGSTAMRSRDFAHIADSLENLRKLSNNLLEHVPSSREFYQRLTTEVQTSFLTLLEAAKDFLCEKETDQFKTVFGAIKGYALFVPCCLALPAAPKDFSLINQLVFETMKSQIGNVERLLSFDESTGFDFFEIRSQVILSRDFGGFIADHYTLFFEEIKASTHEIPQKWLPEISRLCHSYFQAGRDLSKITLYAILGVVPSASIPEIRRAYKSKARLYHPDKSTNDASDMFRQIKDAHDSLIANWKPHPSKPFDQDINRIGDSLRDRVKVLLKEDRYDIVESLLFKIPSLSQLKTLVVPQLPHKAIQESVEKLVIDHVKSVRVSVDSLWAERKYRELNDCIEDLQTMEFHFKSHQSIFPASWNDGIVKTIQEEIERLGNHARGFLTTRNIAEANKKDFRRCILHMGCVLVDLPHFYTFTKAVMSDVLECSLAQHWGFAFLFELGLSLRRCDEDTEDKDRVDEARIAYSILSEFNHFKEIETMTWNSETTQKPAEDTVLGIKAHDLSPQNHEIPVCHNKLLQSFSLFESEYKSLLGEFLRPEADQQVLAQRTIAICNQVKPTSCERGWDEKIKAILPRILAGVFALFTVSKSGESFRRVDKSASLGEQILMKPHNIQILTLLYMFGCDSSDHDSLESQLLRIRTGEGKSMILGAAATVLGLLGFKVRCVCYSEYLSCRDYALFKDIFEQFGLRDTVTYSKITSLSEDTTAAKGDLRSLTDSLMHGKLSSDFPRRKELSEFKSRRRNEHKRKKCAQSAAAVVQKLSSLPTNAQEEILLVDEVDVFFGTDFYGQTYNQVAQIFEPEIRQILEIIWKTHKDLDGRRQHISGILHTEAYKGLLRKIPSFKNIIDNEILLMLDHVRLVNDKKYFVSADGRIGYKDMDTINYNVTYGYRTSFAYLQEYDSGKIGDEDLAKHLCMQVSCGQFSYANIRPARIMGVSGTLEAMGDFEKSVLAQYGISKFVYMPSVYGKSNFEFQKAGKGLYIESTRSDFFHKVCSEITKAIKKKRAVIVFFRDTATLHEFEISSFYRQLGRQKSKLVEDMAPDAKDFVIKKAATSGQITICSAAFGRGTDFFCKDQRVQDNGGVHVIQTFLSTEQSEEIQIQGRTARQGKEGTYQMILLDSDLQRDFDLAASDREGLPKNQWYGWLSDARKQKYKNHCDILLDNLQQATKRDCGTHKYFDALLAADEASAFTLLQDIYFNMKKRPMPSKISIELCFAADVSGSMCPYMETVRQTIAALIEGSVSVGSKLRLKFPEVHFEMRAATLAFKDIDDGDFQFCETSSNNSHFIHEKSHPLRSIQRLLKNPSGGHDLAEDVLGALYRCARWNNVEDWSGDIKFIILFTDAPAHGMVPQCSVNVLNADSYATLHPEGLNTDTVADALVTREIDLFLCSFNPAATATTESALSKSYLDHQDNVDKKEITVIPIVTDNHQPGKPALMGSQSQHIVFVLDESGSMSHSWSGVVTAYHNFLSCRMQNQNTSDLISVVQFSDKARTAFQQRQIASAMVNLDYGGGGTHYGPAAAQAQQIVLSTPGTHEAVVVFMSDGLADEGDAHHCASIFSSLNVDYRQLRGTDLELHVIAFGAGLDQRQLQQIMNSTPKGKIHTSVGVAQLSSVFVDIANNPQDVADLLEKEIGRRISDAVTDKLVLEYLR